MEDVLCFYHLPYGTDYPVVCMDVSNKQLIGKVRTPIPGRPGQTKRIDDEYIRNGFAQILMEGEPLAGKRHVRVTARRARRDWAHQIKSMLDERYPEVIKVRLIMDNLNTHNVASPYETFDPQEAQRLASRLEIHHTTKHGGWLNMVEIEPSVLEGQCLDRRIADIATMKDGVQAWKTRRNNSAKRIHW